MDDRVAQTYKYLRIITPLPAVWLLLAIAVVWVDRKSLLPSISDYYGGPLRDVFVGSLMASAIAMIAYKGSSKLEDYALNFAGVNAFFVALVSNSFQSLLDTADHGAAGSAATTLVTERGLLVRNLHIGVWTFLFVAAVFLVLDRFFMHWTEFSWSEQTTPANIMIIVAWVLQLVLLVMVVIMQFGGTNYSAVHFGAAVLLVGNLSFAAASHAFPAKLRKQGLDAPDPESGSQQYFRGVTVLMWLGLLIGLFLIYRKVSYAVIGVEAWEIVLFLAFWLRSTVAEWNPHPGG